MLGPVAVTVAARDWFPYTQGIFNGCSEDYWVVDHAVTLFGYQKTHTSYWLIRNSWGPTWGENGFIRVHWSESEDSHCGVDHDPQKGTGCDGGPSQVNVCGTCGVLFDSVVPHFRNAKDAGAKASAARLAAVSRHRPALAEGPAPRLVRREQAG